MDIWLNLVHFQGKIRNKDRSKPLKVSGLRLKSEAKDTARDDREQPFLKFFILGLFLCSLKKIIEDSQKVLFMWIYLLCLLCQKLKQNLTYHLKQTLHVNISIKLYFPKKNSKKNGAIPHFLKIFLMFGLIEDSQILVSPTFNLLKCVFKKRFILIFRERGRWREREREK